MEEQIVFGEQMIPIKLPENAFSAPPGLSTTLSPVDDVEEAIQRDAMAAGRFSPDEIEEILRLSRNQLPPEARQPTRIPGSRRGT